MKKIIFFAYVISFLFLSVAIHSAPVPSGIGAGELLKIRSGSQRLCVYGQTYGGVFYASVDWQTFENCSRRYAPKFIFTVSGQVMARIYTKWWCLTAPTTPAVSSSYDYVQLLPCSIFDPNQEWQYDPKTNGLVTAKNKYELRERNWTLAVSASPGRLNKFYFDFPNFNKWVSDNTQVRSRLTFPLPLGWRYQGTDHYISKAIYYNPETKKIFMVSPRDPAQMLCLRSQQVKTKKATWDKVDFVDCDSPSVIDELSWEVDSYTPKDKSYNGVIISDKDGNILRVANKGSGSGNPYTASIEYSKKDISQDQTSVFITSEKLKYYLQLESANVGKSLPYCPAPGGRNDKFSIQITPRLLPSNFNIDLWWERIYTLVKQPGDNKSGIGSCGTCFMQALEVIREMYLHAGRPLTPTQPGIYYPTDGITDLIQYVREHDPDRYRRAVRLSDLYRANMQTDAGWEARQQATLTQSTVELFLPQYEISTTSTDLLPQGLDPASQMIRDRIFDELVRGFDASPNGTIWTVTYTFLDRSRREHGHAIIMIRTQYGLQLLNTNIYRSSGRTMSFEDYRTQSETIVRGGRGLQSLLLSFVNGHQIGANVLRLFDAHRVDDRSQGPGGPLSVTSSFGPCNNSTSSTGAETGGFGSGITPSGNDMNQCSSSNGKCYLQ